MKVRKDEVKSLWESQVNEIFTTPDKTDMDVFLSILSIVMYERFDENIGKLYSLVSNVDIFTTIVNTFSGMTIKIPERDELKKAITLGLSYYYKEIKGYDWKEIQKQLPYENNIPLKNGKGLALLDRNIKEELQKLLNEDNEEN